ncbi:MAG TPA: hypothetical protein PLB81_11780, partial [Deltaproteobacteria bacterium]|nr:hypothetical protein [Deltaproteobacteria bacterium]
GRRWNAGGIQLPKRRRRSASRSGVPTSLQQPGWMSPRTPSAAMAAANASRSGKAVAGGNSRTKAGAITAIPLKVRVASHCPLMHQAAQDLSEYLAGVRLSRPARRIVFNASARTEDDPERIRKLLADQLVSPVRWVESIEHAIGLGIDHFIEIGPKSVLAAMVKRIAPRARVETRTIR